MPLARPRETKEYLKTTVTSDVALVGVPQFAFTLGDERPDTWHDGAWLGAAVEVPVPGQGVRFERAARTPLIGDGGVELDPSDDPYQVWIKLTDAPEEPVDPFDTLTIT